EEIDYLLRSTRIYFPDFPKDYDATAVGARPILGQAGAEKLLSREYEVIDHERHGAPGFLTIGGGKMSDFRVMAEAVGDVACRKPGVEGLCSTQAETLDGQPLDKGASPVPPSAPLKQFLRKHPRLREAHAWGYLAAAYLKHAGKRFVP